MTQANYRTSKSRFDETTKTDAIMVAGVTREYYYPDDQASIWHQELVYKIFSNGCDSQVPSQILSNIYAELFAIEQNTRDIRLRVASLISNSRSLSQQEVNTVFCEQYLLDQANIKIAMLYCYHAEVIIELLRGTEVNDPLGTGPLFNLKTAIAAVAQHFNELNNSYFILEHISFNKLGPKLQRIDFTGCHLKNCIFDYLLIKNCVFNEEVTSEQCQNYFKSARTLNTEGLTTVPELLSRSSSMVRFHDHTYDQIVQAEEDLARQWRANILPLVSSPADMSDSHIEHDSGQVGRSIFSRL